MKTFLLLFPITVIGTVSSKQAVADAPRPNILYFYVDDMGWGSIGPNGQAERRAQNLPSVRTPNIDKLAAHGINFQRGYACTVCSPSRASQQSGFHQGHSFSDRNDPNNAKKAMRADDILMGDVLSAAGYVTGYWGKWGYGGSKDMENPTIDNVQTLPTSHGYQHVLAELHHVRAHTFFQPTLWHAPAGKDAVGGLELVPNSMTSYRDKENYPETPALQNHPTYPHTAYCDDSYSFAALDFVRAQGQNYNASGRPFFGLLAVQIPHAPFGEISALPDWDRVYADDPHFDSLTDQSRQWAAMVTRIDAHFGNILAALEDPNQDGDTRDSVADNTLVIFQSDNGGPSGKNNTELNANGGLRESKGKIQEGGIRVPLVMRWPAHITDESQLKAGSNSNMIVDITDLLPTFCELAGARAPLGVDGVSIAPALLGKGRQRHRDFIIHEAGNGQSIIRGRHKLIMPKKGELQLYDLEADHREANNIATKHPEMVKELEALLIGERVTEPKGFANTYHHWTGKDGAVTSEAGNWSDYVYANADITYMTDAGTPQLSWVAHMKNSGNVPNTARADKDVRFLALEIGGNSELSTPQALLLEHDVNLTGRNEIRISKGGTLTVNNGTVSSLRWIDIRNGGSLSGTGTVDAAVFNDGAIIVNDPDVPRLTITSDYFQSTNGELSLEIINPEVPGFNIKGQASLSGTLTVNINKELRPKAGDSYTIITARRISGRFNTPKGGVVASDGTRFMIEHTDENVILTAR